MPTDALLESGQADEREQLGRSCLDHVRRVAAHPQAERDVAEDVAMREERVILEHEADAAPMRRNAGQVDPVEQDAAGVGHLQAGDHAQQGRLPGAARAEHGDDLAVRDVERRGVEGLLAVERDRHGVDLEHQNHPPRRTRTRSTRSTATTVTAMSTTASA